ncbi:kelch repeat and BTB domain-containing protein 12-like [Diadema antillarum]|uniref:kelch repeat and BTB domain-containing protein 12-like n=1 Tax=Diadema antillarum TaxID=105358 RepID=UPI003A8AC3A6
MDDECKITLTAVNKREWPGSTLKSLNAFRQSEQTLCDIFLRGEDSTSAERVPAHRCVLAANSVYFHAMFTSGLAESNREHQEVTIRGVWIETLALIVDFLYTGSCRLSTGTMHNVMDILAASTMLQVDELSHACSVYLEKYLDSNNAHELWLFGERYGLTDFAESCKRYVQTYFQIISRSDYLIELGSQDIVPFLSLGEVNMGSHEASEDVMVELLLRWVQHDPQTRIADMGVVARSIQWDQVSMAARNQFQSFLESHRDIHGIFDGNSTASSKVPRPPRQFFSSLCVIGGLQNSRAGRWGPQTNSMEVADISVRDGTLIRRWAKPRGFHSHITTSANHRFLPFQGRLYAVVVQDKSGLALSSMARPHQAAGERGEILILSVANIISGSLKPVRTLPRDVASVWWELMDKHNYVQAMDERAGVVYLCGCTEQRDGAAAKRVFRLDLKEDQILELASLPSPRSHHRAIVANGTLFVLGGVDWTLSPLSSVLRYNSKNYEWEEVSSMHEPKIDGAFACVDGKIYATGGSTSKMRSRGVEVYDASLDLWNSLSPLTVSRVNHRLVDVGAFLFAIGGQSYSGENGGARNVQRRVERYSIADNTWEDAWDMDECRWGMTAFAL